MSWLEKELTKDRKKNKVETNLLPFIFMEGWDPLVLISSFTLLVAILQLYMNATIFTFYFLKDEVIYVHN